MDTFESIRQKQLILENGFTFTKTSPPLKSGEIKWRCTKKTCTAKVYTLHEIGLGNTIVRRDGEHRHLSYSTKKIQRRQICARLKRKAIEIEDSVNQKPSKFLESVGQEIDSTDVGSMMKTLYRTKRKILKNRPDFPLAIDDLAVGALPKEIALTERHDHVYSVKTEAGNPYDTEQSSQETSQEDSTEVDIIVKFEVESDDVKPQLEQTATIKTEPGDLDEAEPDFQESSHEDPSSEDIFVKFKAESDDFKPQLEQTATIAEEKLPVSSSSGIDSPENMLSVDRIPMINFVSVQGGTKRRFISGDEPPEEEPLPDCKRPKEQRQLSADDLFAVVGRLERIADDSKSVLIKHENEDIYDNFGKYIASVLRSVGGPKAFKLQQDICNLVTSQVVPNVNHETSTSRSAVSASKSVVHFS